MCVRVRRSLRRLRRERGTVRAEMDAAPPQLHHEPVPQSVADKLGNPRCAFVTGGPREYLAGLNCISKRLEVLRSRHPLLVMVEPEEESFMRHHVMVNSHPSSAVVSWARFPDPQHRNGSWRYRSAHVMDKMNLFGMPFRRLVWIDADVFVRKNVDELCDLSDDVLFASALDAEGKPTRCWPKRGSCPGSCARDYDMRRDAHSYVALRSTDISPAPSKCPYTVQSGVMTLTPMNLTAFNELVVEPVSAGKVFTYDGGDQGIINTLMYGPRKVFGDRFMRLHPRYNVIARHAKHTETKWRHNGSLTADLLHFTRETRPWQGVPRIDNVTRVAEWTKGCAGVVCSLLTGRQHSSAGDEPVRPGYRPPSSISPHPAWEVFCGLSPSNNSLIPSWMNFNQTSCVDCDKSNFTAARDGGGHRHPHATGLSELGGHVGRHHAHSGHHVHDAGHDMPHSGT